MNKITAFIPARGGSKGVPGKNIKMFAGKPLIIHSIEYAQNSKLIDEVVVSTDDEMIAQISTQFGATIIERPSELSTDTSTTETAIQHFIDNYKDKPDIVVLLQPTSPLRPDKSLSKALKYFSNNEYDSLLSIAPTHRFFWRIKEDNTAFAEYDFLNRRRRQDIKIEDMRFVENGSLYIFTRKHFEITGNRLGGKIGYVQWPEEYSYEIDSQLDFDMLEQLFFSFNK